jgi:hypothetical protein
MQLLVSTPLHILLVDSFSGRTSVLRAGDGYYYGITYKQDSFVLSHSGGYLGYFNSETFATFTVDHLIQPHQIEWVDDKILVANTGKNCVSVFDDQGNLLHDVYLNEIRWDDKDKGRKGNHFNSVHRSGERVYVVAHNYDRPSEIWELSWPDLNILTNWVTGAAWAHNFWDGEWGIVTCNSKAGTLHEVVTGETLWTPKEKGVLTRGLAVSAEYVFVGRSLHNERKERYWKDGGIWILDRKTLKILDKIMLPGSGDVHEIRLIGVSDECHNDQIIPQDAIANICSVSPVIAWAYRLRQSHRAFRQDVFPLSQIVRTAQMTARWRRSLRRAARKIIA